MSLLFAVIAYMQAPPITYFELLQTEAATDAQVASFITFLSISSWSAPFVSSFYVGCIVLLSLSPASRIMKPLQPLGRMALTNYLLQTAIILVVGAVVLDMKGTMTYIESAVFCVATLATLIVFSHIWLKKFRYGSFEWLWRFGTYLKRSPFRY